MTRHPDRPSWSKAKARSTGLHQNVLKELYATANALCSEFATKNRQRERHMHRRSRRGKEVHLPVLTKTWPKSTKPPLETEASSSPSWDSP